MTTYLYLSLIPEALIASMLSPEEFGAYYAVGTQKKSQGQAMFIELDPDFRDDFFAIEEGYKRCVPHEDGTPKKSVYISGYRVLEHVPLAAMRKLYLVTAYGQTLALEPTRDYPQKTEGLHMYQEIAPVHPLVVSTLGPLEFFDTITKNPLGLLQVPTICYVELLLGELATDPEYGGINDLPYTFIHHLRECLVDLKVKRIHNKMVNRTHSVQFPYRTIKSGVFVGNQEGLLYFPLPSREKLRNTHYRWWRSANF